MDTGAALTVLPDEAWAGHVAQLLAARLAERPQLTLCLPTGTTPLPVYERWPKAIAIRGADPGRATVVLLDEYLGFPPGHPARCDAVLRRTVLDRLEPAPAFVTFDVDAATPEVAVRRFDDAIAAAGGLDLVILGLGTNGHVGMNEPGSGADAPTRVVTLAPSTREAAVRYGADPPPTHGLTLGMAGILAAREIWLVATGAAKAAILARTLDGPPSPDVPASLLRGHPGLRVIVDASAAASGAAAHDGSA